MERITVDRLEEDGELPAPLRIAIHMKVRPAVLGPLLLAVLLCGGLAIGILVRAPETGDTTESLLGLGWLLFFAVPALLLAARLVWLLSGRETILIRSESLAVRRSVGPFAVSHTYFCSNGPDEDPGPARRCRRQKRSWEFLCLETSENAIVLHHHDRYIRLARDLDKAEGVYVLTAIRIWMQER